MLTPLCVNSSGLCILKVWGSLWQWGWSTLPPYRWGFRPRPPWPRLWHRYCRLKLGSTDLCGTRFAFWIIFPAAMWVPSLQSVLAFLKKSWFGLKWAGWFSPGPQLISRSQHQPLRYISEIHDLSVGRFIVLVQWMKKATFQTQLFRVLTAQVKMYLADSPSLGSV